MFKPMTHFALGGAYALSLVMIANTEAGEPGEWWRMSFFLLLAVIFLALSMAGADE